MLQTLISLIIKTLYPINVRQNGHIVLHSFEGDLC